MSIRLIDLFPAGKDEEISLSTSKNGQQILTVTTPFGDRKLDSPYNPAQEAEKLVSGIPAPDSCLVLGSGAGYLPEAIIKHGIKKLLLVTGSPAAAAHTLKRLEPLDADSREITVIVTNRAETAWHDHITPFLSQSSATHLVTHPREWNAFPGLYGSLAVRFHHYHRKAGLTASPHVKRVLFFGEDGLLEPELKRAMMATGLDVVQLPLISQGLVSPEEAIRMLETHKPDLVMSTNNQGSDIRGILPEACGVEGVPWATWFLDDPRFILTPEEQDQVGQRRWGFHWDRNGSTSWRTMGFPNGHLLPLATELERFHPHTPDPSLAGRVVFVGSPIFQRATGYFAALMQDPVAEDIAEALMEEVLLTRHAPSEKAITSVLQDLDLESHFATETRRRLPAYVVQLANRRYRREMLTALAPLHPVVFGSGWEGLLPDTVELRGVADYNRDLPVIYSSDAVHLSLTNLQMRSHPNQRIFDAGACGGVVVMEHLEGAKELFPFNLESLLFSGRMEMLEKIEFLLKDSKARKEYGTMLHDHVCDNHTVKHRVQTILDILAVEK